MSKIVYILIAHEYQMNPRPLKNVFLSLKQCHTHYGWVTGFVFQSHCISSALITDDIVERYDNLSKSVTDRNEKLQITLTRSMSVQDGLDEMMGWMAGVEASVKEKAQIPLDSVSIGNLLSKEAVRPLLSVSHC